MPEDKARAFYTSDAKYVLELTESEARFIASARRCEQCKHSELCHPPNPPTLGAYRFACAVDPCDCQGFVIPKLKREVVPMSSGDRDIMDAALVSIERSANSLLQYAHQIKSAASDAGHRPATEREANRNFESWADVVIEIRDAVDKAHNVANMLGVHS